MHRVARGISRGYHRTKHSDKLTGLCWRQDGVLLLAAFHGGSACEQSQDLMPSVDEMADEFRGVVFASVDVSKIDSALDGE